MTRNTLKDSRMTKQELLELQKRKLKEMRDEFFDLISNHPRKDHGGTPNIIDNSKGKAMIRHCEKHDQALKILDKKIKLQKEKIERTESKLLPITQTKKSLEFIGKNGIHELLYKLQEEGKIKQWAKNPQYFFVIGLEKVALCTFNGEIGISKKYGAKTTEEFNFCKSLIAE